MGRNHQFDLRPLSGSNQSKLTISLRTAGGIPDPTPTGWAARPNENSVLESHGPPIDVSGLRETLHRLSCSGSWCRHLRFEAVEYRNRGLVHWCCSCSAGPRGCRVIRFGVRVIARGCTLCAPGKALCSVIGACQDGDRSTACT